MVCWSGRVAGGDRDRDADPVPLLTFDCCFIPLAASLGRRINSAPVPRMDPVELERE